MSNKYIVNDGNQPIDSFVSFLESPEQRALGFHGQFERSVAQAKLAAEQSARIEGYTAGKKKGYDEGYLAGFEIGRREAEESTRKKLEAATNASIHGFTVELQRRIDVLNSAIPGFFEDAENAMTDQAITVVRNLLEVELATSRAATLQIVREALKEITTSNHARIRVGMHDASEMMSRRAELLASAATLRDIEIVEDESITAGCVIECSAGVIDATLDKRIEAWEDAFRDAA